MTTTKQWFDEFMARVTEQNKGVIEEIDRLRARIVSSETADINMQTKIGELFTENKIQNTRMDNF